MNHPLYPTISPFTVAWRKCCPRCGEGELFEKFLKVTLRCKQCNLDFSKADTADGPAVFLMLILGTVVSGMIVWVEFKYAPSLWVHMVMSLGVCAVGAYLFLPYFKALLIAQQYRTQSGDCEENRFEN